MAISGTSQMSAYRHLLTIVPLLLLPVSAVIAQPSSDFNGDGAVDFSDFFLFADAYGGDDTAYDLDGNGRVDLDDFFVFTDAFGEGTAESQDLSISRFAVTPTDQIYTTGRVSLAVIVRGTSPDALFYTWSASSGEFDGTTTERLLPSFPGYGRMSFVT
jgi:hypothetical protein